VWQVTLPQLWMNFRSMMSAAVPSSCALEVSAWHSSSGSSDAPFDNYCLTTEYLSAAQPST
jgi:hypothetical protein